MKHHASKRSGAILLLGLLVAATTICYIDRQALSIAAPTLRTEFAMSNFGYSTVLFAFLLAYAVFNPFVGRFIDRVGTRAGLALAVIFWSLASMLHALATGPWSLGLYRFLLGAGEAANFPACVKAVAEQIPSRFRALASGIFTAGAGLGAIIAPPLVATLILGFGWQLAFVATGVLGFLWAAAWLAFHRSRWAPASPSVSGQSCALEGGSARPSWRTLLGFREVRALMLARFISDPVWYFYLFWLPEYLHSAHGFDLRQIAYFAWIPFLSADLGSVLGGGLSAYCMGRGWSLNRARKTAMAACAACMPFTIAAAHMPDVTLTIGVICLATFAHQAWTANVMTLPADLFPSGVVASVYGLTASASSIGAMIFMLAVGWMVDHLSYAAVFWAVGLMHPLAAVVLFRMVPRLEPLMGADEQRAASKRGTT